jgi:heme/copper-type cytochrome/quinol oxidase subunit 2
MPVTETTLLFVTIAAVVGWVVGILGTAVWSARRQAAAALLLEQ